MYQLSMNVACHVIFGHRVDWQQNIDSKEQTTNHEKGVTETFLSCHVMSLVEALSKLTLLLPFIIVFPQWFLRLLPLHSARTACQAYAECDQYMDELLATEATALSQSSPIENRRSNLVSTLLRSKDGLLEKHKPFESERTGFTNQEVKGNMFVFLLAGRRPCYAVPIPSDTSN